MRWLLRLIAFLAAFVLLGVLALLLVGGASGRGRHAAAVELRAPATAVFAHLVEPELVPKWLGGLQRIEPVSGGALEKGARAKELFGSGDETFELQTTITALEPNRLLGMEIRHEEFVRRALYVVKERTPESSVLVYEANTRYEHPSARVFVPILAYLDQRKLEEDLLRLKALVEAPLAPAIAEAAAASAGPTSTSDGGTPAAAIALPATPPPAQPDSEEEAWMTSSDSDSDSRAEPVSGQTPEAPTPAPGEPVPPAAGAPPPSDAPAPGPEAGSGAAHAPSGSPPELTAPRDVELPASGGLTPDESTAPVPAPQALEDPDPDDLAADDDPPPPLSAPPAKPPPTGEPAAGPADGGGGSQAESSSQSP